MNTMAPASSAQNDLKQQLRQLESIAALSGGIAHDYNNLLTAIMGNLSLALETMDTDAKVSPLIENALAASRIAKTLTRTLITFSKGRVADKIPHGHRSAGGKYHLHFPLAGPTFVARWFRLRGSGLRISTHSKSARPSTT